VQNYFNEKNLHSIDSKGRILLPKDIRGHFEIKKGNVLHLIPNLSGLSYLEIRPAQLWKRYRDSLRRQDAGEKKKDSFRYAQMLQETATADGQGRILIPQRLREVCQLGQTVAVINMDIYIEVWSKEHMDQKYADMVRAFKELNDRLF
jgi:division/cell wall cluster transcriptional repressor MraZ